MKFTQLAGLLLAAGSLILFGQVAAMCILQYVILMVLHS